MFLRYWSYSIKYYAAYTSGNKFYVKCASNYLHVGIDFKKYFIYYNLQITYHMSFKITIYCKVQIISYVQVYSKQNSTWKVS